MPPQPQMKVAEGQTAEITCEVIGKPDPIITWYRDRSLITGGRFKILPTGNLRIDVSQFRFYFACNQKARQGITFVTVTYFLDELTA